MTPNSPTPAGQAMSADTPETRGDALLRQGLTQQAIQAYLDAVTIPAAASLCLKLARCYDRMGNHSEACRWALSLVDANDDYTAWQAGWTLFQRNAERAAWPTARTVKVAIAGSYTTTQLGTLLRLAAARIGIRLDLYESPYGQYQQDIIDPGSPLYRFSPDIVVLAVHEGDVHLAEFSSDPTAEIQAEITRWTTLWNLVTTQSRARIVQHNFALPSDIPAGHLATRLPGSRYMMTQALNMGLGQAAGTAVSIVDCERLSALIGKQRWCDPRYWNMSKQAVALDALPLLAKHTAAVIAADIGLSRKCLVLDLDNTLWGGVIAEDGLAGIRLGHGAEGEAFVAFQEYLLKLKRKGVILAVCSKNNHADAIQPFQQHPEMRMKMQDIALFIANWNSKPENIRTIADTLQIGLYSLVFVDDNPVEREIVRKFLPQVDVLPMPEDPAYYVRTLSQYLLLETASMTAEDSERTTQYQARAQIKALEA
ncbi:MAG: HAD-IIIC family phosphatase, partial [Nitrospira sp.]|nr:HAD-IIIC family phosphatase [Nitrospira sp.]